MIFIRIYYFRTVSLILKFYIFFIMHYLLMCIELVRVHVIMMRMNIVMMVIIC